MRSTWDGNNEVRQTLETVNLAWREKRFGDMIPFLDENIVMKGPGLRELTRGRDAFVQSYSDFMSKSVVLDYRESNHAIDVSQTTAFASYDWSMQWEQGGKQESGSGQDLFVFERCDGGWVAVLRVMLF